MSIFCIVKKREADAVYLWCDICDPSMHMRFNKRVAAGESYLDIPFAEWQTLSCVAVNDNGEADKTPFVERVIDPHAERPAWLK